VGEQPVLLVAFEPTLARGLGSGIQFDDRDAVPLLNGVAST
jgi:hypothetical protein